MKKILFLLPIIAFLGAGCSGLLPNPFDGGGKVVSVEYLSRYEGGGSLSALWYKGSDEQYHYFAHYVKVSTKYRIPREDLVWENEFKINSGEKSILVNGQLSEYVRKNS